MCHATLRAKTKIAYQTDSNMPKNDPRNTSKKLRFFHKKILFWTVGESFCVGVISRTRNTNGFSYKWLTHKEHAPNALKTRNANQGYFPHHTPCHTWTPRRFDYIRPIDWQTIHEFVSEKSPRPARHRHSQPANRPTNSPTSHSFHGPRNVRIVCLLSVPRPALAHPPPHQCQPKLCTGKFCQLGPTARIYWKKPKCKFCQLRPPREMSEGKPKNINGGQVLSTSAPHEG